MLSRKQIIERIKEVMIKISYKEEQYQEEENDYYRGVRDSLIEVLGIFKEYFDEIFNSN